MPTTPSYFHPSHKPSWRLTVTVLYLRVRQARSVLAKITADFGVNSCAELQARAVLAEANCALNAVRLLPANASANKWPAIS